ncbi:hypothetical protein JCM16303_002003 [Sporobolomyces ruberrimus]
MASIKNSIGSTSRAPLEERSSSSLPSAARPESSQSSSNSTSVPSQTTSMNGSSSKRVRGNSHEKEEERERDGGQESEKLSSSRGDPNNGQSGDKGRDKRIEQQQASPRSTLPGETSTTSLPLPYAAVVAATNSSTHEKSNPPPPPSHSSSLLPPSNPDDTTTTTQQPPRSNNKSTLAFEVDDLLGPRRSRGTNEVVAQASTTASSHSTTASAASSSGGGPPSQSTSSEDHSCQEEGEGTKTSSLKGLGFVSQEGCLEGDGEEEEPMTATTSSRKLPGSFRDGYFDDGEDTDESSWLHYSSSSSRSKAPQQPHQEENLSMVGGNQNPFGSPLSPHVPPFSPGLIEIGQRGNGFETVGTGGSTGHPWATPPTVTGINSIRIAGAREREASWNSVSSDSRGVFPSPSLRAAFGNAIAPTSDSHASSTRSYSPFGTSSPSSHGYEFSSTSSPAFPHPSNMPFTPPSSHLESFDSCQSSQPPSSKEIVASRYVRAPYTIPSTVAQSTSATNGGGGGGIGYGGGQAILVENNNSNSSVPTSILMMSEDISTLFVFGFPEDMMEREFQNLFLFAPGFEAATLKVPHSSVGEGFEGTTNGINGHRGSFDDYDPRKEVGGGPLKKQKIGFAKFSTRQDALDAMEVLNRKRIDLEKGLTLRADMAKKNLHVRKSITGFPLPLVVDQASIASSVSSLSSGGPGLPLASTTSTVSSEATSATPIPVSAFEGNGPSIPLSALDSATLQRLANSGNVNPAVLAEIARQGAASSGSGSASTPTLHSTSNSNSTGMSPYEAFHSVPPRQGTFNDESQASPFLVQESPRYSSTASLGRQSSFLHQQQQTDEGLPYSRSSSNFYADTFGNPSPLLSNGDTFSNGASTTPRDRQIPFPQQQSIPGQQGVSYGPYGSQLVPAVVRPQTQAQQQASSQLAQQQAQIAAAQAYARTLNPADMNAPKNTLYVGGLPAILPSLTGPFSASHLEDSLRNAFSRCPGFKRLQFRSKSNGPIVFVEFEDTAFATRAMNEMYGYTLGGLVKGGIRLSYSKNPLGVRSNGLPSGNPPLLPTTLLSTSQVDPSMQGVVYPSYGVSYGNSAPPPLEPHRRHPDPYYGGPSYASSSLNSTPNLSSGLSSSASFNSLDQQHLHHRTSSSTASASAIGTPSQNSITFGSTTAPMPLGSTFAPFGPEY